MKSFYLAAILLLGFSLCEADREEDILIVRELIKTYYSLAREELAKSCYRAGGQELENKVTTVFDNFKICLGNHLPINVEDLTIHNISESSSEEPICTTKRIPVQDCFKELIELWRECPEDETEKFLPNFVFDALKAVLDYICLDEKAFFQKVSNSAECFFALLNKDVADLCDNEFSSQYEDPLADQDLKAFFCKNIGIGKTCFGKHIKKECPKSDLNELFSGVIGAVDTACDKKH